MPDCMHFNEMNDYNPNDNSSLVFFSVCNKKSLRFPETKQVNYVSYIHNLECVKWHRCKLTNSYSFVDPE